MTATKGNVSPVAAPACELGESPYWDASAEELRWIDILGRVLHRRSRDGRCASIELSETVTAIAPALNCGMVAAAERGFAFVDADTGRVTRIGPDLVQEPGDRMNDGACDPLGRFWAGSMAAAGRPGNGGLWVLHHDHTVEQVLDGITESNGLAWTPNGKTAYYVDTGTQRIDRLTIDPRGPVIRGRQPFVTLDPSDGAPDGITLDVQGGVWVALWGSGQVQRYHSDGTLDLTLRVDAPHVTNVAFAGADRRDIFITTAREDLSEEDLKRQPLSGSLFYVAAGVPGLPFTQYGTQASTGQGAA